jgi:hypothetical protein
VCVVYVCVWCVYVCVYVWVCVGVFNFLLHVSTRPHHHHHHQARVRRFIAAQFVIHSAWEFQENLKGDGFD